jgi:hypothetical protein
MDDYVIKVCVLWTEFIHNPIRLIRAYLYVPGSRVPYCHVG